MVQGMPQESIRATALHGSWLYGMKISSKQLFILLWCWQTKKSLEATRLLAKVSYPTVSRWFSRFRDKLPDTVPLLQGVIQAD